MLRLLPYLEMGWAVVNVQYRLGRVVARAGGGRRLPVCSPLDQEQRGRITTSIRRESW